MLDVEDRQPVILHLLFGVESHDVLEAVNPPPDLPQEVIEHRLGRILLQYSSKPKCQSAAIAAARAFVGELRFDCGDQAAIVAFNAEATLLAPLTGDRAALDVALAGIQTAQQTCIVCAVDAAAEHPNRVG